MSRQTKLAANQVLASLADFVRNLGLLFVAAALVDPLVNSQKLMSAFTLTVSVTVGLVLLTLALILAWVQKE